MSSPSKLSGAFTEDPLRSRAAGFSVPVMPLVFGQSNAASVPDGVTNWTYFEGALLAVVVGSMDATTDAVGTAVMIAPGLAVTATHVIEEYIPRLLQGNTGLICAGPASDGLDLWYVRKLSYAPDNDVTYLSLELASSLREGWHFRTVSLTTRTPKLGEHVSIVGFRYPQVTQVDPKHLQIEGSLYAAAAAITKIYHPFRDRVLMPYPVIEVGCGTLKGMSGGAAIDRDGYLLGVLSRGFNTSTGDGPSYVSSLMWAMNRELTIPWPPGLYPQPQHMLSIDSRLLAVEGRERIRVIDANTINYIPWSDRWLPIPM